MLLNSYKLARDPGANPVSFTDVIVVVDGKRKPLTMSRQDYASGVAVPLDKVEVSGYLRSSDKGMIHKAAMSGLLTMVQVEVGEKKYREFVEQMNKLDIAVDHGYMKGGGSGETKMLEAGVGVFVGNYQDDQKPAFVQPLVEQPRPEFIEPGIGAGMTDPPKSPVIVDASDSRPLAPGVPLEAALAAPGDPLAEASVAGGQKASWDSGLTMAQKKEVIIESRDSAFLEWMAAEGPAWLKRLAAARIQELQAEVLPKEGHLPPQITHGLKILAVALLGLLGSTCWAVTPTPTMAPTYVAPAPNAQVYQQNSGIRVSEYVTDFSVMGSEGDHTLTPVAGFYAVPFGAYVLNVARKIEVALAPNDCSAKVGLGYLLDGNFVQDYWRMGCPVHYNQQRYNDACCNVMVVGGLRDWFVQELSLTPTVTPVQTTENIPVVCKITDAAITAGRIRWIIFYYVDSATRKTQGLVP